MDMNASESVGLLSLRSIGDFIPQLAWHGMATWVGYAERSALAAVPRDVWLIATCGDTMPELSSKDVDIFQNYTHMQIEGIQWFMIQTCQMFSRTRTV